MAEIKTPGFFRRSAAMLYDGLLLLAVLFFATALVLPLNRGHAFSSENLYYPFYLLIVSFLFYGWFWTHGGQTLGLRAWKLKILTFERQPVSWRQALLRFIGALLSWSMMGLGFVWILIDRQNRGWHDHLSKTAVFFDDRR